MAISIPIRHDKARQIKEDYDTLANQKFFNDSKQPISAGYVINEVVKARELFEKQDIDTWHDIPGIYIAKTPTSKVSISVHKTHGIGVKLAINPAAGPSRTHDVSKRIATDPELSQHPHLAKFFAFGDRCCWMRYYKNGDFIGSKVIKGEFFAKIEVVKIAKHIASALSALHGHYIVHRDIKPENILIDRVTEDRHCVLADYDLSCCYTKEENDKNVRKELRFAGTIHCAAPELFQKRQKESVHFTFAEASRTDLYSFGAALYEMGMGQCLPWTRGGMESFLEGFYKGPNVYKQMTVTLGIPGDKPTLINLVRRLVVSAPQDRPGLDQVPIHLSSIPLDPNDLKHIDDT